MHLIPGCPGSHNVPIQETINSRVLKGWVPHPPVGVFGVGSVPEVTGKLGIEHHFECQCVEKKVWVLCAVCFKPQRYTLLPTQQCVPSTDCCEGLGCSVACLALLSPSFSYLSHPTSGVAEGSTAVLEWAPPLRYPQGRKLHLSHSTLYSLALASQVCVTTPRHKHSFPCELYSNISIVSCLVWC